MSIDIKKIIEEIAPLMHKMSEEQEDKTQIMLQGKKGQRPEEKDFDPYLGTQGFKWLSENGYIEWEFRNPIWDYLEYTNKVISDLKLHRTRLINLRRQTCYSYHKDFSQRMHIPLITNPSCWLIVDDVLHRYPADGSSYLINTTLSHTAVNASKRDRWHIVGCTSKR